MAYFDNAATTYPKPEIVYDFMDAFYRTNGASLGRGTHQKAVAAGELVHDTKNRIKKLLHCPSKEVIFTPTATIALNIIIQGLIRDKKSCFYLTPFEHNAVTRTIYPFEKEGLVESHILSTNGELEYDIPQIRNQFKKHSPDVIVMSHASNVCGIITPIEEIASIAKEHGAIVVIDMAQTAGLIECNVGLETVDFAVFAGHKTLYGPTGISGFVMKPDIVIPSVIFGGTGFESANQEMPMSLPERFEIGTQNMIGIAGLNAAIRWIEETGISKIHRKEISNRERLVKLLRQFEYITLVGETSGEKIGVVSILIDGISSDSAGGVLDRLGIAVRTGLQCSPLAHKTLGTFPEGTVRFSVSYFTSEDDFKQLENALVYIKDNL